MKKILFLVYILFLLCLTIFSYAFVDQNLLYLKNVYSGFVLHNRAITTTIYIVVIILFFLFYLLFLKLFSKKWLSINSMNLLMGISVAILFFSHSAMLSYDIFNYITTAKVTFFYHENPYIIMPIELTSEPYLLFTRATNKIALYGPVWIVLTSIPYILSFGNFILTLFNFKLFVLLFYFGTLFFIWKISKNALSVYIFGLNPLVLIETMVSNHNDIVMMFLVLFAFFLAIKKRMFLAIMFFVLSIFIKYASLFLAPIFLYILIKSKRKEKIDWPFVFYQSFLIMLLPFLLSVFREEIYPWYGIWFFTFTSLIYYKKFIFYTSLVLSFSLLLRYIPYMFLGTYFGPAPVIKLLVTFVPLLFFILYLLIREKIWPQRFFRS